MGLRRIAPFCGKNFSDRRNDREKSSSNTALAFRRAWYVVWSQASQLALTYALHGLFARVGLFNPRI